MNILFLSRWFPYPPSNGSKLRIYNLLRGLAKLHDVTLISFIDQPEINPAAPELRSICKEVYVVPYKPFKPKGLQAQLGFFSSTPRSVKDTFSPEMSQRIQQVIAKKDFDLVIASQIDMAGYRSYFHILPALFEEVELGVFYEKFTNASSVWNRIRHGLTWIKHRHYLARLLQEYSACTVVSERERIMVSRTLPRYTFIDIIPNCVNLTDYQNIAKTPQPGTLIFTGAFRYYPNYEAMVWFIRDVFPSIQAQFPNVHLTITGDHENRSLPTAYNVTLTGVVDDVRPLIARSWVNLAPIFSGGGTDRKSVV
jgi:glycosyltransferase involved in cell wall biosynthesis